MPHAHSRDFRIAVLTGNRADYGLLQHLIATLQDKRGAELQLIVAGPRNSKELDLRLRIIRDDGFPVAATIELPIGDDSRSVMAKSLGHGVISFVQAFESLRPDALILLGDRVESMAAAQSAYCLGIPIAHIHGGELTYGALDDAFRHCITKLAQWHFVASPAYARRVKQLGEPPATIFTVGPAVLDRLSGTPRVTKKTLEKTLKFSFGSPLLLSVLHPETAERDNADQLGIAFAEALQYFLKQQPDATIIAFASNSDAGGSHIYRPIRTLAAEFPKQLHLMPTLPPETYFNLLRHADLIVGNSSSGILEAPLLGTVSVNIGSRQDGRQRQRSIVDCGRAPKEILAGIRHGLSLRGKYKPRKHGRGSVAKAIVSTLLKALSQREAKPKHFYDLR